MLSYLLYRLGQFLAVSLPLKAAYRIAVFFSDLHYLFADKDRKVVTANLKAIFPQKSQKEIAVIRLKVFRNFAKYLIDFFRLNLLDSKFIKKNVKLVNTHHIKEALNKNKGAIILTAHIGNWELGGVVIAQIGFPIWAVALEHKDKRVNDFFNGQREIKGMRVFQLGKAVRQCLNVFKQNGCVALVGDRDFTAKGMTIDFFGKPAILPEGPAAFHLKTGTPIVPVFMIRNPDDTFSLIAEKPMEFGSTHDKENDIKRIIENYKVVLEDYIRKYADQWYMFRPFWSTKPYQAE